jgi:predicted phosphohydrolase
MPVINLISDLHLDISGYQALLGGDVLIIAGDVCEAKNATKEFHSTKLLHMLPGSFPCADFFKFECAKYKKVFYVLGNHEHYNGKFWKTKTDLEKIMPDNVTILENQCEEYEGVLFVGATLWTDLNRGDWHTAYQLKHNMNDFHVIQNYYAENDRYGKLIPEYTAGIHFKTVEYFKTVLEQNRDKPVVVITHHAPSFASVNAKYKGDTLMNGGYASELGEFILDHPNIKYFFHGHMHDPVDYMIGSTRIVANPRGYVGHEDTSRFNPGLTFEV